MVDLDHVVMLAEGARAAAVKLTEDWLIDSGANVKVVPPNSWYFRGYHKGNLDGMVKVASGSVRLRRAWIAHPFCPNRTDLGYAATGSANIFPSSELTRFEQWQDDDGNKMARGEFLGIPVTINMKNNLPWWSDSEQIPKLVQESLGRKKLGITLKAGNADQGTAPFSEGESSDSSYDDDLGRSSTALPDSDSDSEYDVPEWGEDRSSDGEAPADTSGEPVERELVYRADAEGIRECHASAMLGIGVSDDDFPPPPESQRPCLFWKRFGICVIPDCKLVHPALQRQPPGAPEDEVRREMFPQGEAYAKSLRDCPPLPLSCIDDMRHMASLCDVSSVNILILSTHWFCFDMRPTCMWCKQCGKSCETFATMLDHIGSALHRKRVPLADPLPGEEDVLLQGEDIRPVVPRNKPKKHTVPTDGGLRLAFADPKWHLLLHTCAREGCMTCAAGRRARGRVMYESSVWFHSAMILVPEAAFTFDLRYFYPESIGMTGGSGQRDRYCGIVRLLKTCTSASILPPMESDPAEESDRGISLRGSMIMYARSVHSKKVSALKDFIMASLVQLGIESPAIAKCLVCDREGSVISVEMQNWLVDLNIRVHLSAAEHHSNLAENAVRVLSDTVATVMHDSAIPAKLGEFDLSPWAHAVQYAWEMSNARQQFPMRTNSVPKILKFGQAGRLVLARNHSMLKEHGIDAKTSVRSVGVCLLGYTEKSSGCVDVLSLDQKVFTVMYRDIVFLRESDATPMMSFHRGIDQGFHDVSIVNLRAPTLAMFETDPAVCSPGCEPAWTRSGDILLRATDDHDAHIPQIAFCSSNSAYRWGKSSYLFGATLLTHSAEDSARLAALEDSSLDLDHAEVEARTTKKRITNREIERDLCKNYYRINRAKIDVPFGNWSHDATGLNKRLRPVETAPETPISGPSREGAKVKFDAKLNSSEVYSVIAPCAYVTRNATKDEKASEKGRASKLKELGKMRKYAVWDFLTPVSEDSAIKMHPKGKFINLLCLTHVKDTEEVEELQELKSRFVGDGSRVKVGGFGGEDFVNEDSYWAPLASMGGARMIMAHSLIEGTDLLQFDGEAFYLQHHMGSGDLGKEGARVSGLSSRDDLTNTVYYIRLPEEVIELLTPEEQARHRALRRPVYRVYKSIYGVDRSGFDAIVTTSGDLKSYGWVPTDADPSVYTRVYVSKSGVSKISMLGMFSDDGVVSAERHEQDKAIREISTFMELKITLASRKFTGIRRYAEWTRGDMKYSLIAHPEHIDYIADRYKSATGVAPRLSDAPMTKDITDQSQDLTDELFKTVLVKRSKCPVVPEKWRPKLIGCLLWRVRVDRPECFIAVQKLSKMLTKWDSECDAACECLIGYLVKTRTRGLVMQAHKDDTWNDISISVHADANLAIPKSTSGHYAIFVSSRDTFCPYGWECAQQTVAAMSTESAELYEQWRAVQFQLAYSDVVPTRVIRVLCDNMAALTAIAKGYGKAVAYLGRAVGLRLCALHDLAHQQLTIFEYVESKKNAADFLTKVLGPILIREACRLANILDPPEDCTLL